MGTGDRTYDQDDAFGTRDLGHVYRSDTGSWRAVRGSDTEENQGGQAEGEDAPGAAASRPGPG